MVIRTFLPVGQGAFYLEQFEFGYNKVNIIYDCGSSTDVNIINKEIRNNFEKGEIISAVFISHLDRDHINGLPYLLKYCDVKKLFFPLLTQENQTLILLKDIVKHEYLQYNDFFVSFIKNPYEAFNKIDLNNKPKLYMIQENEKTDGNNNIDAQSVPSGKNVADLIFDNINNKKPDWSYVPFNFREKARISELKKALEKEFGKNYTCDEISETIINDQNILECLKRAYKSVTGSFNVNSMTLFSGIQNYSVKGRYYKHYGKCNCHCCCECYVENGCLYTGDYDASGISKWRDLSDAYSSYMEYIGCIQIPHHGSRHNYNHNFMNVHSCCNYVISAGEKNKYRHPHNMVIKDVLFSNKAIDIVTENVETTVRFIID